MSDQRYNGWTNYETWNVALWLDNDEGTYQSVRDAAEELREDNSGDGDDLRGALAQWLRDYVEEMAPDLGASMFSDLLGAALSEVDWFEIAENVLSETQEDITTIDSTPGMPGNDDPDERHDYEA